MDVFDLTAKISLDSSEYERGLDGAKQSTSIFGDVFKANIASDLVQKGFSMLAEGAKKAASGLVSLTKSAVEGFSNYEQLSGGVQKLYGNVQDVDKALETSGINWDKYSGSIKGGIQNVSDEIAYQISQGEDLGETAHYIADSYDMSMADAKKAVETVSEALKGTGKVSETAAQLVMKNAQQAYKTAGMSANEYMETATQFSASLISSLSGNAYKAAQQTDVAMRAISDNVNTFGSNIEDVTNAFKGFSKQNYTMLDNLKLG